MLYHQLTELSAFVLTPMTKYLREIWTKKATARAHESIFQEHISSSDYIVPRMGGDYAIGTLAAKQLRKDANIVISQVELAVEDEQLFGKRKDRPLMFAASYGDDSSSNSGDISTKSEDVNLVLDAEKKETTAAETTAAETTTRATISRGIHLIIFQHGYQGTTYDLRLFRDMMTFILPKDGHNGGSYHYLIASSNERQTDGNIEMMGHRLATEVSNKISTLELNRNTDDDLSNKVTRLSFIGHSLGSVIIRSALTSHLLTPYVSRLYNFISLTSPHIGFFYAPGIVNTAVWLLKRWHKSLALEQLSLSDDNNLKNTFFFKLSKSSQPLSNFKHIILVGSHQDNYAPYHSARIEMTKEAMDSLANSSSNSSSKIASDELKNMITNILQHIEPSKLTRIDVDFKLEGITVDNSIGRAAHIRFLDSFQLTINLILGYHHLWKW